VERLLCEICEELGFSLPARDVAKFERLAGRGVDAFADEVFLVEGLDPRNDKSLRNKVRERVARHLTDKGSDAA
jgi:hypothetical protein